MTQQKLAFYHCSKCDKIMYEDEEIEHIKFHERNPIIRKGKDLSLSWNEIQRKKKNNI